MASVDIPRKAKAAVRQGEGDSATAPVTEVDVPSPGPGEILVKIEWCVQRRGLEYTCSCVKGLAYVPQTSHFYTMNGRPLEWP